MSLARADGERTEKLSLEKESDDLVSTRRSDLNALTQQVGGDETLSSNIKCRGSATLYLSSSMMSRKINNVFIIF